MHFCCFNWNLWSHSKASYLASRRERERIVPDSETGVYKRTMSPNGHAIVSTETISDPTKVNSRETKWPTNKIIHNNNTNLIRRVSMTEKSNKNGTLLSLHCESKEDYNKKPQVVLPDVLPVKEKIMPHRSQYPRPTQLEPDPQNILHKKPRSPPKYESPPSSPTKSPSRNSPFTPLRSTLLSSPLKPLHSNPQSPLSIDHHNHNHTLIPSNTSTPVTSNSPISRASSSPLSSLTSSSSHTSPTFISVNSQNSSPTRTSPSIVTTTATTTSTIESTVTYQSSSPFKTSPPPLRTSPPRTSPMISTGTNTPLQISPSESPPISPKPYFTSSFTSSPPQTPTEREVYPKVVEGLQMIQRTEVILRVNVCTTDAASQTEREELPPTPLPTRRKLQEEIECEKLSQDLVKQLPASDRLKDILLPGPDYKKPTDYITGLFRPEVTSRPRPANSPFRSRTVTPNCSPPPSISNSSTSSSIVTNKNSDVPVSSLVPSLEPSSPLSPTSLYFTTSEPKAKFLTRYSQDMNQFNIVKDTKDLNLKKVELVNRLDRKLEVLRSEQLVVSEECKVNDELGENVEIHMNRLARPHEAAKFRLHVEEVGKITSLLLGLSGRLARAENALMEMTEDHPEKRILESKRDKLKEQLEEAKKLKESIDRRSVCVSNILYKYLNSEEYADYDHFINMKAKLIMDAREIADKIKLGEEQLIALQATLTTTD